MSRFRDFDQGFYYDRLPSDFNLSCGWLILSRLLRDARAHLLVACNQVTRDAGAAGAFTGGDAIYGPRSVEHWKEKEEE